MNLLFPDFADVEVRLRDVVHKELSGQRVLWQGAPSRSPLAWFTTGEWIAFGLAGAFVGFWLWLAVGFWWSGVSPAPVFFIAGATAFLVLQTWNHRVRRLHGIYYAVNEHSALIFELEPTLRIRAFDASVITGFSRETRAGQAGGSICFLTRQRGGSHAGRFTGSEGFFNLETLDAPAAALREMLDRCSPTEGRSLGE
jgi:hypothetical protein